MVKLSMKLLGSFLVGFMFCFVLVSIGDLSSTFARHFIINCCGNIKEESIEKIVDSDKPLTNENKKEHKMVDSDKPLTNENKEKQVRLTDLDQQTTENKSINILSRVNLCDKHLREWYNINERYLNNNELESHVRKHCITKTDKCVLGKLTGPLFVDKTPLTESDLYANEFKYVKRGGWWRPDDCTDIKQTAIIIPYRDRAEHLFVFLRQIHPILQRQKLHYRIFVIEQDDESTFNRGKLMNVGFTEANKYFPYSCFVFHDVDLVPEDDRINHACKHSPMHLSVAIDKFHYVLPYAEVFGGIEMFTPDDYKKVNGYPNMFWHWGGEDDNLYYRCVNKHGMMIHRQSVQIARYQMLKHISNQVNKPKENTERNKFLKSSYQYINKDGLTNLQYAVKSRTDHLLYTLIKVDLRKEKDPLPN